MPSERQNRPLQLEDLPNIGKSIAADLRGIGIGNPQQLAGRDPLSIYNALSSSMGRRHDPCVLYVLLAARHFSTAANHSPGGNSPNRANSFFPQTPVTGIEYECRNHPEDLRIKPCPMILPCHFHSGCAIKSRYSIHTPR